VRGRGLRNRGLLSEFLRGLRERGLGRTQLVISDHHRGLMNAIDTVMVGATWPGCRVHFICDVLASSSSRPGPWFAPRSRPSPECSKSNSPQWQRHCVTRRRKSPVSRTSPKPTGARYGAATRYRLYKEVKRRTDVVGIFPNPVALLRLATCVLIESHDEWQVAERRYLTEYPWPNSPASPERNHRDQHQTGGDRHRRHPHGIVETRLHKPQTITPNELHHIAGPDHEKNDFGFG
jgi:transposase-like protein